MWLFLLAGPALLIGLGHPEAVLRTSLSATVGSESRLVAECLPLAQPKRMPALGALLDSISLANHFQVADTTTAPIVVGVFLSNPPSGVVLDGSTSPFPADSALRLVLASLRSASKSSPVAFRVHVEPGRTPRISLERSFLCAPELLEEETLKIPFKVGRVVSGSTPSGMPSEPRSVTPRLRINSSGRVVSVDLVGGTGFPEIDRGMRDGLLRQSYRPALLDGRPVEVWLTGAQVEVVRPS